MHSHYHHTGRRVFFWTLVILYIGIISVVVPYAFGYRFSLQRGVFVYAGSITLKTNPRDVTITVDGHPARHQTYINNAYHISGLDPGTHTVSVERDGFRTLTKTVTVSSGISTEFWNIILPRTHYARTPLATLLTTAFYHNPGTHSIIAPTRAANGTLIVQRVNTADSSAVATFFPLPHTRVAAVDTAHNSEWSQDGTLVAIPLRTGTPARDDALIMRADGTSVTTLRDLFPAATAIDTVRWSARNNRTLYAHIDDTLTAITLPAPGDRRSAIRTTLLANDVRAYTIADNALYYLTRRTGLVHRRESDGTDTQITLRPSAIGDAHVTLTVYDRDRIALRGEESGTLELFNTRNSDDDGHRILGHAMRGAHFSDDGKKLLYWNDHEIFVTFLRDWNVQPLRKRGETFSLARFRTPVRNVQWSGDYEHVLYTTDDALKLTALDDRGGRTTATLLTGLSAAARVRADAADNRLYISTADTSEHTTTPERDERTAPHTTDTTERTTTAATLFTITFPEKSGIF